MHKLKITNCNSHIEEITLKEGSYTIGRLLESSFRLESNEVSRLHARLLIGKADCEIMDEGSTNGTFVNGNRITSSFLVNGDKIKIGRFNLEFLSERANHNPVHIEEGVRKSTKKIALLALFLMLFSFVVYRNFAWKKIWTNSEMSLARAESLYIAEKNKEVLYLGEYASINLNGLSPKIREVAIVDRHNILRLSYPEKIEPLTIDAKDYTTLTRKGKYTLEIYTPIYYDSVRVGTVFLVYDMKRAV